MNSSGRPSAEAPLFAPTGPGLYRTRDGQQARVARKTSLCGFDAWEGECGGERRFWRLDGSSVSHLGWGIVGPWEAPTQGKAATHKGSFTAESQAVTLAECPIGLFMAGDELCLKTQYGGNEGRIDAYIVASGEFFSGGAKSVREQRAVLVQPVCFVPFGADA